jgi:hypothetical protein
MLDVNGFFDYRDPSYGNDSSCWLRIYQLAGGIAVAIATEIGDNKGPSITNTAEAWAREAQKEYSLDPNKTWFVEHYDRRGNGSYGAPVKEMEAETYDIVSFQWDYDGLPRQPKWRPIPKKELEALIGEQLK